MLIGNCSLRKERLFKCGSKNKGTGNKSSNCISKSALFFAVTVSGELLNLPVSYFTAQ